MSNGYMLITFDQMKTAEGAKKHEFHAEYRAAMLKKNAAVDDLLATREWCRETNVVCAYTIRLFDRPSVVALLTCLPDAGSYARINLSTQYGLPTAVKESLMVKMSTPYAPLGQYILNASQVIRAVSAGKMPLTSLGIPLGTQ